MREVILETIKLVWRFIVAPLVEVVIELAFFTLWLHLTTTYSAWFGIPLALSVLGFMATYSTTKILQEELDEATGIEISPKYCEVARNRLAQQQLF